MSSGSNSSRRRLIIRVGRGDGSRSAARSIARCSNGGGVVELQVRNIPHRTAAALSPVGLGGGGKRFDRHVATTMQQMVPRCMRTEPGLDTFVLGGKLKRTRLASGLSAAGGKGTGLRD